MKNQYLDDKNKNTSIFSIHIHPDNSRFATAGLDTRIKIWNLIPLINVDKEDDPTIPKLLATMSLHNGTVLCVRFSNLDGRFLASGADDTVILIWELDRASSGTTPFGCDTVNVENWKVHKRLTGHESDVVDLSWSFDNSFLASCGLDSKVYIWDGSTFEKLKRLDGHDEFVKGLAWDPAGKFLASQSDDKTIKIWNTTNWKVEKEITEPFVYSTGTTFFRRLSWSPDGEYIGASNALNGTAPVAVMISRTTWDAETTLVGHESAVEVVTFNPCIFKKEQKADGLYMSSIVAVGSQDRSISIWTTGHFEPLAIARSVFDHSILDMSWNSNGSVLLSCSYDGTIAMFAFSNEELGERADQSEVTEMLVKFGLNRKNVVLLESTTQLLLEQEVKEASKIEEFAKSSKRIADLMGPSPINESADSEISGPPSAKAFSNFTSQQQALSNDIKKVAISEVPKRLAKLSSMSKPATVQSSAPVHQIISKTKDGKKRITPQFLGSLGTAVISSPRAGAVINNCSNTEKMNDRSSSNGNHNSKNESLNIETKVIPAKRKKSDENNYLKSKESIYLPDEKLDYFLPELDVTGSNNHSSIILAAPKLKLTLTFQMLLPPNMDGLKNDNHRIITCHNNKNSSEPSKIVTSEQGKVLWEDFLPSPIILISGNALFTVLATQDHSLYIYSPYGRRILPCIITESIVSFMDCNDDYFLCITCLGIVSVWNVRKKTCIMSSVPLSPVILSIKNEKVFISSACVKDKGIPVISLSNGTSFAYDIQLQSWTKIIMNPAIGIFSGSDYTSHAPPPTPSSDEFLESGSFIQFLEWEVLQEYQKSLSVGDQRILQYEQINSFLKSNPKAQALMSVSHLEHRIATCLALQSPSEFKFYLKMYARRLAKEGLSLKAQELCEDLLGPPIKFAMDQSTNWDSSIMGMRKRELLGRILPLLSINRHFQTFTNDYKRILDDINEKKLF